MSKNILNKTRVYLAGNLENCLDSTTWREVVKARLKPRNITILSPRESMFVGQRAEDDDFFKEMAAYSNNPQKVYEEMSRVVSQDLRMIDICDFIIANIETSTPTFGTTHEVVIASHQKKPTFVNLPEKTSVPLWLAGLIKPKYIYDSLESILKTIEDIDDGIIEIDLRKWRLLLPELR